MCATIHVITRAMGYALSLGRRNSIGRRPPGDLRAAIAQREHYRMLDRVFARQRGQGLVEYALIIALVSIVVVGILILIGPAIGNVFSNIHQPPATPTD